MEDNKYDEGTGASLLGGKVKEVGPVYPEDIESGPHQYLKISQGWVSKKWDMVNKGNGHKLKHKKFRGNMKKNYFEGDKSTLVVVQRVVPSPLRILNAHLNVILCNLLY